MTLTEIVDRILRYYSNPGNKPGRTGTHYCTYYRSESCQCAIGCLLDDPAYLQRYVDDITHDGSVAAIYYSALGQTSCNRSKNIVQMIDSICPTDLSKELGLSFLSRIQSLHDSLAFLPRPEFRKELMFALHSAKTQFAPYIQEIRICESAGTAR